MIKIAKTVQEMGNGGHIYLPKELIGQQVIVIATKTEEEIKKEVLDILFPYLEHIKGVYLHGSYARGEQTPESDIDIMVIADKKLEIEKKIGSYEIISTTLEGIKKTIENNAPLILPMLREAKPIINSSLINELKKSLITKKSVKWYIDTTKSALKIAETLIKDELKSSIPNITYTLMLRTRGLLYIRCLREDKPYSNRLLFSYLEKKGLEKSVVKELYILYTIVRDNKKLEYNLNDYGMIRRLLKITKELLNEIDHGKKKI
jgi:predicted nucleotidyltransferase|tara:strand:- start:275 stop:1060 length:786 start_codon:yes stop_codon:yes gene_type:complete